MVYQDVLCARCNDSCYGDVVSVQGKVYHQYCFSCIKCKKDLMKSGYFFVDGEFYCNNDYYKLHGTKCDGCGKYVEGEVISALDVFYHPECFGCRRCGKLFPPEVQITYDGDGFRCEDCSLASKKSEPSPQHLEEPPIEKKSSDPSSCCAGCGNDIKSGQALLALEKQWHLWCFTCHKCGCLLAGEYMGRDGVPYCEQDYQSEFGVTCAGCGGYITGKVLQAGEKHYHPQCSRCAKCGQMFGEGEEMYLQGSEIWHPQCSEEFQREIEENDKWLADNEFQIPTKEDGPVESSSPKTPNDGHREFNYSTSDTNPPKDTTSELKREPPPYGYQNQNSKDLLLNGYGNHGRQSSHSSEGSSHTGIPPSYSTATSSKPAGFRSVKPPVSSTVAAQPNKNGTPKTDSEDEEDAPPKPPPPTRTSSNAFRDKYRSGVYSATPFQKPEPKTEPTKPRPLSYIESAAAKKASADNKRTTISIYTRNTSNNNADDQDDKDGGQISPTSKVYQKGAGFNKLQARKTVNDKQKHNGFGPLTEIGPEIRRKLQQDTHPYEVLKTTSYKMPFGVDRKRLEVYLNDREFYQVFQMTREKFYILPKWKQDEMKKKSLLF